MQVSIIVLTYKKFETLFDTLSSIASQSFTDYEVILQDDGSPNYSPKLLESYIAKIPILKEKLHSCSNPKNVGTVKNYNIAIARSKGEIIVPLSSDDKFADENVLYRIVEHFRITSCNVCAAKRRGINTGKVYPSERACIILKNPDGEAIFKRCLFANLLSGSSLYIRKSYLYMQGLFDENYALMEDYPFVLRLLKKHERIDFLDFVAIDYGENGVSNQKGKISEKMKIDNLNLFYTEIQPNLQIFKKEMRRYIEYQYITIYSSLSPMQRIVRCIEYFDIIFLKGLFKHRDMTNDDIYEFLLDAR